MADEVPLARYYQIIEQVVLTDSELERESALANAFEMGRVLVRSRMSPDDLVALHHEAVARLGQLHPELSFSQIAERLNLPLMELTMAHGMVFREQLAQRYEALMAQEHASKLEALGTLAAGIAHDFNNIVGCILGFAELAGDDLPPGSRGLAHIEQVTLACYRARDLVARMLAYARKGPNDPERLDIAEQVRAVLRILSASIHQDVQIAFHAPDRQPAVMASPVQIQQIVMNLCLNAADAMSHQGNIDITLAPARQFDEIPPGHEEDVCLSVADNGCGMPPQIQARVFEPFFTTKAPRGSGLGLSVIQGIVRQLGGAITLRSRHAGEDTGTEFRIFLPPAPPEDRNESHPVDR